MDISLKLFCIFRFFVWFLKLWDFFWTFGDFEVFLGVNENPSSQFDQKLRAFACGEICQTWSQGKLEIFEKSPSYWKKKVWSNDKVGKIDRDSLFRGRPWEKKNWKISGILGITIRALHVKTDFFQHWIASTCRLKMAMQAMNAHNLNRWDDFVGLR